MVRMLDVNVRVLGGGEAFSERLVVLVTGVRFGNYSFESVETSVQLVQLRSTRNADERLARAVENNVSAMRGVDVEGNARNNDGLLTQELLEHDQAGVEGRGERFERQPDVECRLGLYFDRQTHFRQSVQNVLTFVSEELLQRQTVLIAPVDVEHG